MPATTLTKYHGLGNDFLVLVEPESSAAFEPAAVVALCDRHHGFGADGVLRLSRRLGGGLRMELRNADGGEAETSGNGLRCAVLAAAHAGLLPSAALGGAPFTVETAAGPSLARLLGDGRPGALASVAVAMGTATVAPAEADLPVPDRLEGSTARRVAVGNPHLVLLVDELDEVDLAVAGPPLEASVAGGCNVELVRPSAAGGVLSLAVWERGVGLTKACGSGSCAAAAVARSLGLAGDRVVVANPGGELLVELTGPAEAPSVTLTGPACRIGTVSADLDELRLATGASA